MSDGNKKNRPPRLGSWLVGRVSNDPFGAKTGDFEEEFRENVAGVGFLRAYLIYWKQLFKSIPGFLIFTIIRSGAMLKSYFKIAIRNLLKNRIYSLINITGLTIGFACCLIVLLYAQSELSYNDFHDKGDRLYRVLRETTRPNRISRSSTAFTRFAGYAQDNLPEIEKTVRITSYGERLIIIDDLKVKKQILFADSTFFDVFSFPLQSGSKDRVLEQPNSVVVSKSFADQYYPEEEPFGKIIMYDGKFPLTITGIMADIPENSDYQFDLAVSFVSLRTISGTRMYDRGALSHTTFFLLKENVSAAVLEEKMSNRMTFKYGRTYPTKYYLQPLDKMHTEPWLQYANYGDIKNIYMLSGLAIAILLIACVNYINLSSSFGIRRSKEVGLKKAVGAGRSMLVYQFLGESIFLAVIALVFSVIAAYLFLPVFNELSGRNIILGLSQGIEIVVLLGIIAVTVGVIAGLYPALFISGFKPVNVIKGKTNDGTSSSSLLRRCLVVFQFSVSLALLIGMIVFREQLGFIHKKDLGFTRENILTISLFEDVRIGDRYNTIRDEFLKNPDIYDMTAMHYIPGTYSGYLDGYVLEGRPKTDKAQMALFHVSANYFEFFDIPLKSGRCFEPGSQSDIENAVILNKKAVEMIGWDNPIGKNIKFYREKIRYNEKGYASSSHSVDKDMRVIGIIENYHGGSLKDDIKPMIFRYRPDMYDYFSLKINPDRTNKIISFIDEKWSHIAPNVFLDYFFNDDRIAEAYKSELRNARIINISSIIAIMLAGMGLIGLLSYNLERRIKELGIRKVMGAAINNLIILISKDFLYLILISNIIAWPAAYFILSKWLDSYVYRIEMNLLYFIEAGALTALAALTIICAQTIKAASRNPVDSLRYD